MKRALVLAWAVYCCLNAWNADAVEAFSISAVEKTKDKRASSRQELPRGSTETTTAEKYYRFDIRVVRPGLPDRVTVRWVVLLENINGRLTPATLGEKEIAVTFGQTVSIETDPYTLRERSWSGTFHQRTAETDVFGYGIHIVDEDGTLLAEKYNPGSVQEEVERHFEKQGRRPVARSEQPWRFKLKNPERQ